MLRSAMTRKQLGRGWLFQFSVGLLALLVTGSTCSGQEEADEDADAFRDAALTLAEDLPLAFEGSRMVLQMPTQQEAQGICSGLVKGGSSGSSFGQNAWLCTSESEGLRVQIGTVIGMARFGPANMAGNRISLSERKSPLRQTTIIQTESGTRAVHMDPDQMRLVWLQQIAGRISLVRLSGAEGSAVSATGWEQLGSPAHAGVAGFDLKPVGIGLPELPAQEESARIVRGVLGLTAEQKAAFRAAFAGLDAGDYAQREAASKELDAGLEQWQFAVADAIMDPETSAEFRVRLRTILRSAETTPLHHVLRGVTEARMHEDPAVLVQMLARTSAGDPVPAGDEPVYAMLRKISGADPGNNRLAWEMWLQNQGDKKQGTGNPTTPPDRTASDRSRETVTGEDNQRGQTAAAAAAEATAGLNAAAAGSGPPEDTPEPTSFDSALVRLSHLLQFELQDDGKLRWDRSSWSQRFGNRTARELMDQAKADFAKTGLPSGWLNLAKGENPDSVDYPQILFESWSDALVLTRPQERMLASRGSVFWGGVQPINWNRQFEFESISGSLRMHDPNRRQQAPEEQYLQVLVEETGEDGRVLNACEFPDGRLSLMLLDRGGRIVVFGQSADGDCWIHLVRRGRLETTRAESAAVLWQTNRAALQDGLFPMLASFGVNLGTRAGGPLEIVDRAPLAGQ